MQTSYLLLFILFYFLLFTIPKTKSATTDYEADRVCEEGDYQNYERRTGYRSIDHFAQDTNCDKLPYAHKFYTSLFLEGKQTNNIKFLISIIGELVPALLFVVSIAVYVFLLCLWRCHCCLFKEYTEKEQYALKKRCKFLKLIIIIVLFIVSAGISVVGYMQISFYKKSVLLSDCGFLHFTNHGLYGLTPSEDKNLSHYGGSYYLKDTFVNISYSLEDFSNLYSKLFKLYDNIISLDSDFTKDITDFNDYAVNNQVFSPNPNTQIYDYIKMNYQSIFGGYTNSDTILGILYKNYDDHISPIVKSLTEMKTDFESIISIKNSFQVQLKQYGEYFESMEKMYNLINSNIGQIYSKYKKRSTTLSDTAKVFYIINIILIVLLLFFYFFYLCKKEATFCVTKIIRKFVHVIWNLLYLFSASGFLISCFFAVFRKYSYSLIPSFNSLISFDVINDRVSEENLFKDYAETTEIELFNMCYNPTHSTNIIDILGIKDSILSYFNNIYQDYSTLLQALNTSLDTTSIEDYITKNLAEIDTYIDDITKTTSYATHAESDVSLYIKILNKYTDYSDPEGFQIDCITKTYDRWAANINSCPDGFVYSNDGSQSKNCLIFSDWDTDSVQLRYMGVCDKKGGGVTYESVYIYYNRIKNYIEKNKQLVSDMKQSAKTLTGIYKDISDNIKKEIDNDNATFQNFTQPFSMLLGNDPDLNIYDLYDCGLLKNDLIDFYDLTRNRLSKISIFHLVAFALYSAINMSAIVLFLKQLYIFKKQPIEEIEELSPEPVTNNENKDNAANKANEKEVEIISINKSNKLKPNASKTVQEKEIKGTKSKLFVSLGKNKGTSLSSNDNSINKRESEISDIMSEENLNQKDGTRNTKMNKKGDKYKDEDSDQESGPKDGGSAMS